MKRCRICKCDKLVDEFHRRARSRDGLSDRCKACSRELGLQWRANNPDYSLANRERSRQWAANNPERAKARLVQWIKDNPERVRKGARERAKRAYSKDPTKSLSASRKWRADNPRQYLDSAKKWRKSNPEKIQHFKRIRYAREKGAEGSYTSIEWAMMCRWFGNCCLRCGANDVTVDHVIPINLCGTNYIENLQPLCRSCNSSKGNTIADYRDPVLLAMLLEGMPNELL